MAVNVSDLDALAKEHDVAHATVDGATWLGTFGWDGVAAAGFVAAVKAKWIVRRIAAVSRNGWRVVEVSLD